MQFYWLGVKKDIKRYVNECHILPAAWVICSSTGRTATTFTHLSKNLGRHIYGFPWRHYLAPRVPIKSEWSLTGYWSTVISFRSSTHWMPRVCKEIVQLQGHLIQLSQIVITFHRAFRKGLQKLHGAKLNMSSSYQPESDTQTGVVNKRLGN